MHYLSTGINSCQIDSVTTLFCNNAIIDSHGVNLYIGD